MFYQTLQNKKKFKLTIRVLFRVPHRVSLDTGTNENRHENWERVRVRGGNENERKVFQTMLTMNSWEIMALITKKSKYQETNNLCVNEVSVSYINMLFFLNKWKKSCANQSMLVYIVWLQPCKNYTSSQSIVSVCNKKKKSCIWFPLCTNGINIYRAAYLNEPLLSMKTFISFPPNQF